MCDDWARQATLYIFKLLITIKQSIFSVITNSYRIITRKQYTFICYNMIVFRYNKKVVTAYILVIKK